MKIMSILCEVIVKKKVKNELKYHLNRVKTFQKHLQGIEFLVVNDEIDINLEEIR